MKIESTSKIEFPTKDLSIDLSIIIPVHNNVHFTKSALNDLVRLPNTAEIIVVNNASTDETSEVVYSFSNDVRVSLIDCSRNLGFGRACNKGYKHSNGKNVLFLNNDIRFKSFDGWTDRLIDECERGYLVAANGGILDRDFNFIRETPNIIEDNRFYLSGWCIAASRNTFDRLILNHYSHDVTDVITSGRAWGPWNEKFFAYFEDDDLSWRAKELSIPFSIIDVPIVHFGRMTSRKLDLSSIYKTSKATAIELWANKFKQREAMMETK